MWTESMEEMRVERESEGDLRIIMYSLVTLFSQFIGILMVDGILSLGALVMVWGYMWWTLESFFLASCVNFLRAGKWSEWCHPLCGDGREWRQGAFLSPTRCST